MAGSNIRAIPGEPRDGEPVWYAEYSRRGRWRRVRNSYGDIIYKTKVAALKAARWERVTGLKED
jgi:hypothetical protein